jgi:hypothetical protein
MPFPPETIHLQLPLSLELFGPRILPCKTPVVVVGGESPS